MNSEKGQTAGTEMYDRIDRYILGMMDHDESAAFEDEMSSDAALADNVSVRRMIIGEVQRREALRDDFMAIETAHPYRNSMSEEPVTVDDTAAGPAHGRMSSGSTAPGGKPADKPLVWNILKTYRRTVYAAVSVAAAACLAAGIFFRVTDVKDGRRAGSEVLLAEIVQPSRGGVFPIADIVSAVDEGRYGEASALIADCREQPVPEYDLTTEEGRYRHELYMSDKLAVDYVEAVMLLRQGHPAKARKILKSIAGKKSYYSDHAAEILDRFQSTNMNAAQ